MHQSLDRSHASRRKPWTDSFSQAAGGLVLRFLSASLAISILPVLPQPLQAQIAIEEVRAQSSFIDVDARDEELVTSLRETLGNQPDEAAARITGRLPPHMSDADIASIVAEVSGWGLAVVGCREEVPVVGFYSPLDHVWVIVSVGTDTEILDATLARGFWLDEETSLWWPVLWSQSPGQMGLSSAIEADAAFQVEAFASLFPSRNCPNLGDAPSVSPRQALEHLAELEGDAPRPSAEQNDIFVEDFSASISMDLSSWHLRYLLPDTGLTWIAAFTSPMHPGVVLFGEWTEGDDGFARLSGSLVVDILAGIGG
jgi:hypothetical protein